MRTAASPRRRASSSCSRIRTRSPSRMPSRGCVRSPSRIRAAGSPGRACSASTASSFRRAAVSRRCAERSSGGRRCASSSRRSSGSAPTTTSTTTRRAGAGRLAARRLPAPAARDARRARRLRRGLPAVRRGHRPLLPRGEGGLGALVRPGGGRPPRVEARDGPALLHAPDALALARYRALRAQASGAVEGGHRPHFSESGPTSASMRTRTW